MTVDTDEMYRGLVRGEVFAEVGVALAKAGQGDVALAESTLASIRGDIARLKADKVKAPTGLASVRAEAIADLRAQYGLHVGLAEDRLGQPDSVKAIARIDPVAEHRRLAVAQRWIAAIDAVGGA